VLAQQNMTAKLYQEKMKLHSSASATAEACNGARQQRCLQTSMPVNTCTFRENAWDEK
jgi:hypothetical protein